MLEAWRPTRPTGRVLADGEVRAPTPIVPGVAGRRGLLRVLAVGIPAPIEIRARDLPGSACLVRERPRQFLA